MFDASRLEFGLDDAGELRARRERQLGPHLVLALHDQQVGEVQRGRVDRDQHLVGRGLRGGALAPLQGRGAVQRFTHPGVHGDIQFLRKKRS